MWGWFSRGWCGSYVNQLGQWCYSLAQEGSVSLGKAVCLQSLNPLKHLPAFTGLSFIFLFIVPGLLYGKCGTSLHSEKQLRLTNKQTDKLKDNKACGQTWWWSGQRARVDRLITALFSLSRTSVHVGQTDSLLKGSVFAASVFKQWMHSYCYLQSIYFKCETVVTYYGQSVVWLYPHLRGHVEALVLVNTGGMLKSLCDQTTHLSLAHVWPSSVHSAVLCVCWYVHMCVGHEGLWWNLMFV